MATIASLDLIKISTLTLGLDTYQNLRGISHRENPLPTYAPRAEGSLRPSESHDLPSDQLRFSGVITADSESLKALSGTSIASMTATGVNAHGGAALTATYSNVRFKAFSGGSTDGRPETRTLSFECSDVNVV